MFTFKKKSEPIFYIQNKPVYTTFEKDHKFRIPPFRDTVKYLESEDFREGYDLSRKESKVISRAIKSDIVPEQSLLKTKFYRIRKDLNTKLFNTIDLRGTNQEIEYRFPEKPSEWPGTKLVIGSSSSGKTFIVKGKTYFSDLENFIQLPLHNVSAVQLLLRSLSTADFGELSHWMCYYYKTSFDSLLLVLCLLSFLVFDNDATF